MKDLGKKKLLMIAAGIIGLVVLIIIILLVFHAVTNKKTSYKDIENKVVEAAKKYYGDNQSLVCYLGF